MALSDEESWKLVPRPSITSIDTKYPWLILKDLHSRTPSKNFWGDPIVSPFPYCSKPKYIKSLPFVPSAPVNSISTEDIWWPFRNRNTEVYGWDFPPQGTQLSNNSSKPDEDISALATDEHVGGSSSVNIDAGTMNITCDGGSYKPPGDGGSNKPPGDVGLSKPPVDSIPFSGSQDVCCAHDGSASACYMCGEAEHFATKCSLDGDCRMSGCHSGGELEIVPLDI